MWGTYDSLQLAWGMGVRKVILEMDSLEAVTLVQRPLADISSLATVRDVRRLLRRKWKVQVVHVYRERNTIADALANYGCLSDFTVLCNYWLKFCMMI